MSLDARSPLPLYYQLKQILIEEIVRGKWRPGDMLPTEQQLQDQYNVSRTTVRQTMQELELEGHVIRYRGRGTFVARPKIAHSPAPHPILTDHMAEQGIESGWRVLSAEQITPPPHPIRQPLNLKVTDAVFRLRRLRLEANAPIGYQIAYVTPPFIPHIDEGAFAVGGSLRYLRNVLGIDEATADRVVEAVPADSDEAALLHIKRGAPLLCIKRVVHATDGTPIEWFRGVYRGDRFAYHINHLHALMSINQ